MKQLIFGISLTVISLALMGCAYAPPPTYDLQQAQNILPAIVVPTVAERKILVTQLPDFYIRFTEQQREILHASGH